MTRNLLSKNGNRDFKKEFYGFFTIFFIRCINLTAAIQKYNKEQEKG